MRHIILSCYIGIEGQRTSELSDTHVVKMTAFQGPLVSRIDNLSVLICKIFALVFTCLLADPAFIVYGVVS